MMINNNNNNLVTAFLNNNNNNYTDHYLPCSQTNNSNLYNNFNGDKQNKYGSRNDCYYLKINGQD